MKRCSTVACLPVLLAATALSVQPGTWRHKTEKDFSAGKFDKTVVTSLGEVVLARATETLLEPTEEIGMVSAVAVDARGRIVLAAAPGAKLYRLAGGKLEELAKLPGVLVRCLRYVDGRLIAGTSGEKAGLYSVAADGEVKPVWTDKEVTFVWAIVPAKGKDVYVATGPKGKVYRVTPAGKATVVYDSEDKNILSLAGGGGGSLYAGTGENGLVVKIDPAEKTGRVLYDAAEAEISRIAVRGGIVYAATSDSTKASADGEAPSSKEKGKPAPATKPAAGKAAGPASKPAAGSASPGEPAASESPKAAPGPSSKRPKAEPKVAGKGPPEAATQPAAFVAEIEEIDNAVSKLVAAAPPGGKPGPKNSVVKVIPGGPRPGGPKRPTPTPSKGGGKGNAVYRIDAEGFVRAVFRRPVTILDMALRGDELLLATGHGGQIFSIDLAADRTSMLVKLDPKDVTTIVAAGKGKFLLGTAGKAAVYTLADALAAKGTFASGALDAKQVSAWGTLLVRAEVPAGSRVSIATRSGNVAKPDDKTWSAWSAESPAAKGWAQIDSPPGRFLQYRLTLSGRGKAAPTVDFVQLVYQVKNLAPVVTGVEVTPGTDPALRQKGGTRMTHRLVKIAAADPNGDALQYEVSFRAAGRAKWIRLAAKHGKKVYAWNATTVPDGVYEIRVEASDAPANPRDSALTAARVSRAVVVDNTPPAVTGLRAAAGAAGKVTVRGAVADAAGRVTKIACAVDSVSEWLGVLPADGICDSPRERFSTVIADLKPGVHHIAVRAVDEFGNVGHASVEVTVGE